MKPRYTIQASVWMYPGQGGWHFVTLPKKQSDQIKKAFGTRQKNWGSLPVQVTLGQTSWNTSVFRDTKADAYVLPLKAEVRKKERVRAGDTISFAVEVRN